MSSTSSTVPGSPRSPTTSKTMLDASLGGKSLTPQRKHHKLLKDGNEVWSEDVEKVFVDGLREYWESPWATYSRGRSRWRNQFLVEHLKKAGIVRSKKQVASHIQVLRNMWRGQPEFHLVAGGEELFTEHGLLAPNAEAGPGPEQRTKSESTDELSSSASSSPDYVCEEFTPQIQPVGSVPLMHNPEFGMGLVDANQDPFTASSPSTLSMAFITPPSSPSKHRPRPPVKLEPIRIDQTGFGVPQAIQSPYYEGIGVSLEAQQPSLPSNRLLNLALWAEGMLPFTVDIDKLTSATTSPHMSPPSQAPSILLRIKISISSIEDIHSPPNLHGFQGVLSFASSWHSEGRCITKIYSGQTCVSQEVGCFVGSPQVFPAGGPTGGTVTIAMPESSLSRCKWLETGQETITQQIVIDGVVLAAFVYHLERSVTPGSPPSAELVGFQKYRPSSRRMTGSQQFSPPISPVTSPSSTNFLPMGYGGPIVPQPAVLFSHPPDGIEPLPLSSAFTHSRRPSMYGSEPPPGTPMTPFYSQS